LGGVFSSPKLRSRRSAEGHFDPKATSRSWLDSPSLTSRELGDFAIHCRAGHVQSSTEACNPSVNLVNRDHPFAKLSQPGLMHTAEAGKPRIEIPVDELCEERILWKNHPSEWE